MNNMMADTDKTKEELRPSQKRKLEVRPERKTRKVFDWLSSPHAYDLTPFQKFVIDVDWVNSPLGPISQWPSQLKYMVYLVMADPTPAVVYWGDRNTIVYNEPYTLLIGSKHPSLQGQDPSIGFAEIWSHFDKLLANQRETGVTTVESNMPLLLHRHGFLEETYFSWKFVPIIGPEGWVVGSHATVVEVTREVLSDRRLETVLSLSRQLSQSSTIDQLWAGIIRGLENSQKDIPIALLYSVEDTGATSKSRPHSNPPSTSDEVVCILEGCVGIPRGHVIAPERLSSDLADQAVLSGHVRRSLAERTSVVVDIQPKSRDILAEQGWADYGLPPQTAVICPIVPANSDKVLAFLIIALNPRRPYDEDYKAFIHLLTTQVTMPQLSALILQGEVERRSQIARKAALDRERLSKELSESETKFARFATRAPIGLAVLTPDGAALSANDLWKAYTQLGLGSTKVDWEVVLCDGESAPVNAAWMEMIATKRSVTIHTRVTTPWRAPELDAFGNEQWTDTFLLLSMYPDLDDNDGEVSTVMSCITDISGLKWSESQLRRRMDQAIEMKKQQERFIDMTSHEMRNPLSALIGCADEITTSLNAYRASLEAHPSNISNGDTDPNATPPANFLSEATEAAATIIYCAMHQKRIIDDILTLSRLDSNLLTISPSASDPLSLARSALKMFTAEAKRASISLALHEDPSLQGFDIQHTLLDPSRVLQILINLLTNAIKFTRSEPRREIVISISATPIPPSDPSVPNPLGIQYVRPSLTSPSLDQTTNNPLFAGAEPLFLCLTVSDTGRGMSPDETGNLFRLFQQASPKTYTKYGGSGLGLFISRQLVEMQGGAIGVASEAGTGSVFQFFVRTRRVEVQGGQEAVVGVDFQLLAREDALREACGDGAVGVTGDWNWNGNGNVNGIGSGFEVMVRKKLHILVVEDNLVNQKVVAKQLRKEGHLVSVANHGGEALEFIRHSTFWQGEGPEDLSISDREPLTVVLLDLEMPVMDGITCVKRIRQLQHEGRIVGHIPVIAVTANAREDQIARSLEAGMDDVTTKPYRIKDMLTQIERVVAKHTSTIMDDDYIL